MPADLTTFNQPALAPGGVNENNGNVRYAKRDVYPCSKVRTARDVGLGIAFRSDPYGCAELACQ